MKISENTLRKMINEEIKTQKLILEYINKDGTINEGPFSAFFKTLKSTAGRAADAAGNAISRAGSNIANSISNKLIAIGDKVNDVSDKIIAQYDKISNEYKETLAKEYQSDYETEQAKLTATVAEAASKCLQNYLPFAQKAGVSTSAAAAEIRSALLKAANTIGKVAKETYGSKLG